MIRLRQSGVDEILIKRVRDWYDPGPGCFFIGLAGTASFSPTSLFAAGEQGAYFDPNNSATLFEDAAGTIPTALERPVGLMLDLSGRGNHATQSLSTARPVLTRRVNQFVNSETLQTQSVTTRATTQTLRFEGTGAITLSGTATGVYTAGTYSVTTAAGTLTATVLGTVTRADLREANFGVGLPAYQRVGDTAINAADYDTAGFPAWLRCSGGQSMVTPSINFSSTDKMTVWAGVRKIGSSGVGCFIELSAVVDTNNGSFLVTAPLSTNQYGFHTRGTSLVDRRTTTGYSSPITNVLSSGFNLAASTVDTEVIPRINGVTPTLTNTGTSTGTGTYGNYPIYLFARNQSSLFFNGLAGPIIVRGAQSSAAEIANAENWINAQQKVY